MGYGFRTEFAPRIFCFPWSYLKPASPSLMCGLYCLAPFHPVSLMCAAELGSSHPVHLGDWLTSSEPHSTLGLKINRKLPVPTSPILRKMNSDHKQYECALESSVGGSGDEGIFLNAFFSVNSQILSQEASSGTLESACFQIILKNPDAIGPWTALGCIGS